MTLDPALVAVRDLTLSDLPFILGYWFRSPPGFIEAMGVDPVKMPKESEMRAALEDKVRQTPPAKLNALVIAYDNKPVGFHTLHPLVEGDHAIFHAHIWDADFRRRGLGQHSYAKACRIFMDRFSLNRIIFKTPKQNTGAIRVKEKLGIRCIGEERIGFGIIRENTPAKVFELTRAEVESWPT